MSFICSADSDRLRVKYLAEIFEDGGLVRGTVYQEWLAYEAVINIHRAYAFNFHGGIGGISGFLDNIYSERSEGVGAFVSMLLLPDGGRNDDIQFLPKMRWFVEAVIYVDDDLEDEDEEQETGIVEADKEIFETVKTSHLKRKELEKIYDMHKEECPDPLFQVSLMGSVFSPQMKTNYTITNFPAESLILPIGRGIGLTVLCKAYLQVIFFHIFTIQ